MLVQHLLQYSKISAVGVIFRERQAGRLGLSPHLALRDVIAYGWVTFLGTWESLVPTVSMHQKWQGKTGLRSVWFIFFFFPRQ